MHWKAAVLKYCMLCVYTCVSALALTVTLHGLLLDTGFPQKLQILEKVFHETVMNFGKVTKVIELGEWY